MKHFLLSAVLVGGVYVAQAQTPTSERPATGPVVSVGMYGVSTNVGAQVEQRLSQHFSLGLQGSRYFSHDYPGYQAALLGRYYFRPTAPAGFYLQAQAGLFHHTGQTQGFYPGYTFPPSDTKLSGVGGGLGAGYQLLLGQHLVIGAGLGVKFYHIRSLGMCDCSYVGEWYATGQPGSAFDAQFNIGYAF